MSKECIICGEISKLTKTNICCRCKKDLDDNDRNSEKDLKELKELRKNITKLMKG